MQGTMEQETAEQREHRVLTRTIDGLIENYHFAVNDREREGTDQKVREFIEFLAPGNFTKYWDYYEQGKES